jgi:hypothetical protein
MPHAADGRALFSSRQRDRLKRLSRRQPRQVGWELTHWSTRTLALAADLQPHLWRSWKTTVWDDEAVARATKILWYYERIEWLWHRGEVVLALDEKPNL